MKMDKMAAAPSITMTLPDIRFIHSRWRGRNLRRRKLMQNVSKNHHSEVPHSTPRIISRPLAYGIPSWLTPSAANSATKIRI